MKLFLKADGLIDPSQKLDDDLTSWSRRCYCPLGKERCSESRKTEILNLRGFGVTQGLIDMHTHLREPGFEYKETILNGSGKPACAGGSSAVACMANTIPSTTTVRHEFTAAKHRMQLVPFSHPAITINLVGKALTENLDQKGRRSLPSSDDGKS
jgi:dihydroorotase